jgi:hypothetical protein
MKKYLLAAVLAVGLGCNADVTPPGARSRQDAAAASGNDATAARAPDGPSPDAAPNVKRADGGADRPAAPSAGGAAVDWADCGQSSFKEGVSAADFCAEYLAACMFDPAGGGSGTERYKSLADCMASYNALSDGPRGGKACVAWQLCIASHPNNAATFCPRAPEASQMSGPCKASYL